MKLIVMLFALMLGGAVTSTAGTIVMEGKYQQKNIFVINSIAPEGVGFCVYEVTVNGEITSDEVNSNAFEVDLSIYGLKLGDDVVVVINYKDGCEPKVLNPGALEPQPTFETVDIKVDDAGMLTWETLNEQGRLPFIIQQYKWNKWVNVGEVMGKGTSVKNNYSFQTNPVSGENKFRLIQKTYEGDNRTSPSVTYDSGKTAITFEYDKKSKSVKFSGETNYELYNEYGQIIKRGFGTSADLSSLPKGTYYVSFDSDTQKFEKK
ncbi:MAG: T9SS type A sorting domain-containing protein [Flavobacteriales bacterium]|nr:T9SS type A sorting domain-containing protein [Flavobacteriales bacterium]